MRLSGPSFGCESCMKVRELLVNNGVKVNKAAAYIVENASIDGKVLTEEESTKSGVPFISHKSLAAELLAKVEKNLDAIVQKLKEEF